MTDSRTTTVAGLFLPSGQLMVQRAFPTGRDKRRGPAMMPDVLSALYCQQQQSTHIQTLQDIRIHSEIPCHLDLCCRCLPAHSERYRTAITLVIII